MMPPKDAWWWNSSMICWASDTSMVSMCEVLLVESAQPLCPLGENLVSKKLTDWVGCLCSILVVCVRFGKGF